MKKRDKYLLILIILTCIARCLKALYNFPISIRADNLPKEIEILGNCTVTMFFLGIIISIVFFIAKIIFNAVKKNNKNTVKNIFLYLFISFLIYLTFDGISGFIWEFVYTNFY